MSLLNFISDTIANVTMSPEFFGIQAKYSRRIEAKDGTKIETKEALLYVSPHGTFEAVNGGRASIDYRGLIVWAKSDDLKFDGVPFLPQAGDVIEYVVDGKPVTLVVGGLPAIFSYEDSLHKIIKGYC
jgi:hypothetical protein